MAAINFGWSNCLSQLNVVLPEQISYDIRRKIDPLLLKTWAKASVVENEGVKVTNQNEHACRVLNNPNELWAKVLKGLYFQIPSSFTLARGLLFVAVVRPFRRKGDFLEVW
ncbi:uncharacterized protein G2W53_026854 [Senna tora]|uniref:Uncharacterized protein n=1 Tax=Senna tora TaxID=362788 RepID=A0A834TPT8_9FABA|nr:uncharacterized protein G2W53_026854 [Senna tora]